MADLSKMLVFKSMEKDCECATSLDSEIIAYKEMF